MSNSEMTPEVYRSLPYTRVIERVTDEEGTYYVARYVELPGLMADGETRAEAILHLSQAFDDYVNAHIEWGDPIPLPNGADRVMHALASAAEMEGPVSIVIRPFDTARPANGTLEGRVEQLADDVFVIPA